MTPHDVATRESVIPFSPAVSKFSVPEVFGALFVSHGSCGGPLEPSK